MKRILAAAVLFGTAVILLATPGADHKILWCHFPPGQWTGNPDTSKVNILSIDVAADGSVGPAHDNHDGDGPAGGLNNKGQLLDANCKLAGSCQITSCDPIADHGIPIALVLDSQKCACVCPSSVTIGTISVPLSGAGKAPTDNTFPDAGTYPKTCGLMPT